MSVFGVASIAGRLGNGYLLDRYLASRVAAVSFAGAAIGLAILAGGATGSLAYVASALLGLAIGAEADVMPYLVSRYFGMRSMAALFGVIFGAYTLGNGVGRYLYAAGFDATGSYRLPLVCAIVGLVVASLGTLTLPDYRR